MIVIVVYSLFDRKSIEFDNKVMFPKACLKHAGLGLDGNYQIFGTRKFKFLTRPIFKVVSPGNFRIP